MRDRFSFFRTASRRILDGLVTAALVLGIAACGLFGRQPGQQETDASDRPAVTVKARNLAWKTVHVYAISGASWQSLGVLASQDEETWTISSSVIGNRQELRLAADPVGSTNAFISDDIFVEPGDQVEWTIQDNLALSSVFVR